MVRRNAPKFTISPEQEVKALAGWRARKGGERALVPGRSPLFGSALASCARSSSALLVTQTPDVNMGFEQYHEPPAELSASTRTFARMITSLTEEAEAIGWYEQRISLEKDVEAKAIMKNAQKEEMKHFGMDLEFLLRKKKLWRAILKDILFTTGDIVEHGEDSEDEKG